MGWQKQPLGALGGPWGALGPPWGGPPISPDISFYNSPLFCPCPAHFSLNVPVSAIPDRKLILITVQAHPVQPWITIPDPPQGLVTLTSASGY